MSNKKDELIDALTALAEHATQDNHIPECPFYRGEKNEKASSGAVTNAYRDGWDVVFGKSTVGIA